MRPPEHRSILGVRIDATSYADATERVVEWARQHRSCYVCCAAVNNIMEARRSPDYRVVMDEADLVTTDGMPLVWMLRALGIPQATRVYGPTLTRLVLKAAADAGMPVGFYGGTEAVLARLVALVRQRFPELQVGYAEAPPFRPPTPEEDRRTTQAIHDAGVRILFVGLGSPKQDGWMHAHKDSVQAVMIGVGAAFDFLAGAKPQAPEWMQSSGLEWAFRLATEPRRLARRYLTQNPKFVFLALAQLLRIRTI
ncbi:MAG: glycosyl transferase, WecB/TagA/CpsF family [Bryobacterales bacterium]|nr:glycosyl transferase, WecB/TagA/CpsF family [Bryobacterales bacterium]